MSTPMPAGDVWLSPSRAWRLTCCPASVGLHGSKPIAIEGPAENKGDLAHKVVKTWIKADGHKAAELKESMRAAIEVVLTECGKPPADWTLTRYRLISRAPMLAEVLRQDPAARIIPEEKLEDASRRIFGTPDIVVVGQSVALIDLKTEESDDEGLISPWIRFQLCIYAYLVEQTYGAVPDSVEVFSTHRGRIPVPMTKADIASALDDLAAARDVDRSVALPAQETCRYCSRRLECQPHWEAAANWPNADCVEGQVERIERSRNGLTGLHLRTSDGVTLLSGIPTTLIGEIDGLTVRAARVYARHEPDGAAAGWKWGPRSELQIAPLPTGS